MKEQIEEMRKDLIGIFNEEYDKRNLITADNTAKKMVAKGYRKQVWISVEERLPKRWEKCLCYYPQKDYGSKLVVDYAETEDGYFAEQYRFGAPSHWMPLPEPPSDVEVKDYPAYLDRPKMKGGAE